VAVNIILFFYKKKTKENKRNNKILPATSACCGAVVRNECRDHFSKNNKILGFDSYTTPSQQPYNNPSHECGPQCVGSTLM
jgi:hypothetical protein